MKTKFILAKAGANSYWSYYNEDHRKNYLPQHKNDPPIVNEVVDCFLQGNAQDATKFDTYEQVQAKIEDFSKLSSLKKEDDKVITVYPGVGIYRIDKVFVIELP